MNKEILRLAIPNIVTNITVPLLGMAVRRWRNWTGIIFTSVFINLVRKTSSL